MTAEPAARIRLTPDRIESAALAIVDRDGVAALSMRRLGAELGVEAMSLYHHVPGKPALLDRVAAKVVAGIRLDLPAGGGWRPALTGLGHALRAALLAHPRAVPLLATRPLDPETGLRLVGPLMGPLLEAGFDQERALLAIQSVAVFTIGHALAETGAGDDPTERTPAGAPTYYDRWFDLGLEALVRGLDPAGEG